MKENRISQHASRKLTPLGAVFAVAGLALFAYFIKKAGVTEIVNGLKRLGAGFVLVLFVSGIRQTVRAAAWTLCFEVPHRLRFWNAFRASVTGDALGNLVPVGIVVSEPAKAAFVKEQVPLGAGLAAITIENLFYSLSVVLFIFAGAAALLLSFSLPEPLRIASLVALIAPIFFVLSGILIVRRQWRFMSGAIESLQRRKVSARPFATKLERVREFEDRVYGFYARHRSRLLLILLLEACFHFAGVLENYVTLRFISEGVAPTLFAAFVLEFVNRVINVVFKFVPLRVGVDEAGSGWLADVLRFGTSTGVTLAIIRKARVLCWTTLGVAFLVRRGLSVRAAAENAQAAIANQTGD